MRKLNKRIPHNAAGDFFGDTSCIDGDPCRSLAPAVFARAADYEQSFVKHQPVSDDERHQALMALVACPTCAIGTVRKLDVSPGIDAFPAPIAPGVYYCGFASEASFGAASYLIRRPEGNGLVESPRASPPLLPRLQPLGRLRTLYPTHRQ